MEAWSVVRAEQAEVAAADVAVRRHRLLLAAAKVSDPSPSLYGELDEAEARLRLDASAGGGSCVPGYLSPAASVSASSQSAAMGPATTGDAASPSVYAAFAAAAAASPPLSPPRSPPRPNATSLLLSSSPPAARPAINPPVAVVGPAAPPALLSSAPTVAPVAAPVSLRPQFLRRVPPAKASESRVDGAGASGVEAARAVVAATSSAEHAGMFASALQSMASMCAAESPEAVKLALEAAVRATSARVSSSTRAPVGRVPSAGGALSSGEAGDRFCIRDGAVVQMEALGEQTPGAPAAGGTEGAQGAGWAGFQGDEELDEERIAEDMFSFSAFRFRSP